MTATVPLNYVNQLPLPMFQIAAGLQSIDLFFQLHQHRHTPSAYSERDMQGSRALTAALVKEQMHHKM